MKIDRERVEHIAALANLELTGEELERMERDLSAVLDYVEQLRQIDTAAVEPMAHVGSDRPIEEISAATMREDEAHAWFGSAEALDNAPAAAADMFLVPKIVERG